MINSVYGHKFYKNRHRETVYAARTILSIVLESLPPVHSAVDFGCGVGTWLSVLKEKGVAEVLGVDGPWVERDLLEIPISDFQEGDFGKLITIDKKFDLAITLEVAEHLSEIDAHHFVESLVSASDFVLFSAAIPFQGGAGHINEQWPNYWAAMFAERDYIPIDLVRGKIWSDEQIAYWYRQNIVLFARNERACSIKIPALKENEIYSAVALVHPDTYLAAIKRMSSVKGSWTLLRRALFRHIKKRLRGTA